MSEEKPPKPLGLHLVAYPAYLRIYDAKQKEPVKYLRTLAANPLAKKETK